MINKADGEEAVLPATAMAEGNGVTSRRRWLTWRELALAAALLVASQIFVMVFAKMAHWELELTGGSKLAVSQLERCYDGTNRTLNEACQMDCCWYASIIRSGYDEEARFGGGDRANWAFFPLFPLFAKVWLPLAGGRSTYAAVVASKIALYFAIVAFMFMVRSDSEAPGEAALAGTLVAFNPAIIFAHGGYAEPLYFALAAMGFALLDRERWLGAGLSGGLLSASRPTGIVFVVAYAISTLRRYSLRQILDTRRLPVLVGGLLCPVGLSLWLLYLHNRTGDALAWGHIHSAWGVSAGNFAQVFLNAWKHGGWWRLWECTAIAGWVASAWLIKKRQYEKGVFLALCILIPATGEVVGMLRFVWWQPPTLYVAFVLLKQHPQWRTLYFLFTGGLAAILTVFWFLGGRSVV
jgi:hypothetical protein